MEKSFKKIKRVVFFLPQKSNFLDNDYYIFNKNPKHRDTLITSISRIVLNSSFMRAKL